MIILKGKASENAPSSSHRRTSTSLEMDKRENGFMDSLYIVMPAYNEADNIESVVKQWYPILQVGGVGSKIVIADSGSTDSTHEILLRLQNQYSNLVILSDTGKQHGPKLMALYDYAIKSGADYIFQTDSDGQTDPREFAAFWDRRLEYDAVIGNRSTRKDGSARVFVERVVCSLLKMYYGIKVPDANAPFRLMKTEVVEKYLYRMPWDYNLPNIMLTTFLSYYKERVLFIEIQFLARQGGKNSINIIKIFRIGCGALKDFWKFKQEMRESDKSGKHLESD